MRRKRATFREETKARERGESSRRVSRRRRRSSLNSRKHENNGRQCGGFSTKLLFFFDNGKEKPKQTAKTNRKRRARPLSKTTSRLPLRQNNAEHQTGSSKRPLRPRRAHYERRQWRERHWRRRRRPLVAAGNGFCLCLRRSAGHGSARVLVAAVPRGVDVPEGRREGAVLDLRDDQLRDSGKKGFFLLLLEREE